MHILDFSKEKKVPEDGLLCWKKMKACGYYLFFWSFILIKTGSDVLVSAVTTREITFVKNANPAVVPDSVMLSVLPPKNMSQFACAVNCLATFPSCTSYLHNSSTGMCIQSNKVANLLASFESGMGDLYVTCDANGGFSMHHHGTAAACISVVTSPKVNYTVASEYCEQMGGYLASVKTLDKLQLIITALAGSNNFWVGMDDMDEEGTYVWKEDGQVGLKVNATFTAREMAEIEMNGLWDHPNEPNNYLDDEHCIQLKYSNTYLEHRLNDYKCYTRSKFICEERVQFG